ncbi:MAG TPA: folylpolyglutamate synthase/dihydrofolate synthase family protein [Actinomycetota bacterium]|nr:folylpolyglutamate synthase/dihydrofolate synthase family protein [Actinomycetota bacterium]
MRFDEALAELDDRQPDRMVPDLARISAMADLLDDPQLTYPTIHVTGTNGKTTTAHLIADLACEHGLRTGLYSSPHLHSVTERISVCGEAISETEFGEEYERLLPYFQLVDAKGERVTYFEALTALAFVWFSDKPVSLGAFEVGMGGAWDATNLVSGDVGVICPIAIDHPELGSTLEQIAAEKAGIVKPGKVVVCREQPPEAFQVIQDRCEAFEARLRYEGHDFALSDRRRSVGGQVIGVRGLFDQYQEIPLGLFGEHAARNAAAAIVAVESFLEKALTLDAVRSALSAASSPGRLEVVAHRPTIVVDGAHNPAGAEALASALTEAFGWSRLHLVIAISANKDIGGIVASLSPLADRAYAARNASARSVGGERVAQALARARIPVETFGSVAEALQAARDSAGGDDLILVTGSLYTVADARRALGKAP